MTPGKSVVVRRMGIATEVPGIVALAPEALEQTVAADALIFQDVLVQDGQLLAPEKRGPPDAF